MEAWRTATESGARVRGCENRHEIDGGDFGGHKSAGERTKVLERRFARYKSAGEAGAADGEDARGGSVRGMRNAI